MPRKADAHKKLTPTKRFAIYLGTPYT